MGDISRRDFLGLSTAAIAGPAVLSTLADRARGVPAGSPTTRPNLLWIMTDQQPVSTVGAYGNGRIRTPNLDRLRSTGVLFDRFYLSAFPCSPSRASLLTGRCSHNHGVVRNDVVLPDDIPTIGDTLKAIGYRTGYVGKWHLGGGMYRGVKEGGPHDGAYHYQRVKSDRFFHFEPVPGSSGENLARHGFTDLWVGGWAHYKAYLREVGLGHLLEELPLLGNHVDFAVDEAGRPVQHPYSGEYGGHIRSLLPEEHHMAAFLAGEAVSFLRSQRWFREPFCLALSFYGPHLPVAPPAPWDDMYPVDSVPLPANLRDDLSGKPARQRENRQCYRLPEWNDYQFRDYIRRYWGYASYIDHQVGRVLDVLDEEGLAENTIVIFTSDHGDMIGGHGFIFKMTTCGYEELVRVPLMIRYPALVKGGGRVDSLVEGIDLLPSLLKMIGTTPPPGIDGTGFLRLLTGGPKNFREIVVTDFAGTGFAVRTERWKYVLNWGGEDGPDLDELYDLQNDPGEMINLAYDPQHRPTVSDMRDRLYSRLAETDHPYRNIIMSDKQ